MKKFQRFCMWIGAGVVVSVVALLFGIVLFYRSLPDVQNAKFTTLQKIAEQRVHARMEKKRPLKWVPVDKMNRELLYAIVMSEDSTFFEHEGVNFDAMVGAALQNLRAKKVEAGASTISQQVVKNLYYSNDRSFIRKIREVIVTRRLEARFGKNEILELYLNVAEFGPDIYGIGAATEHYFKKKPAALNAAEGAFLAIMLPSPRKFHYTVFENQNITLSKHKKLRRILGDMLNQELISPKQYQKYIRYDYFKDEDRLPSSRNR